MTFNVTVLPSGKQFSVDAETTILEAALDHGVVLPYGCKNGACGSCKALVTEGSVEQGTHQPTALSSSEITQGYSLLCTAPCKITAVHSSSASPLSARVRFRPSPRYTTAAQ